MTDEGVVKAIHRVYYGWERKLCEVMLEDGVWVAAEIRSWDRDTAGDWSASVNWTRGAGLSSRFDIFAAERVRAVAE